MQCPTCGYFTPDHWNRLIVGTTYRGPNTYDLEGPQSHNKKVTLDWMKCANPECSELVIRMHEGFADRVGGSATYMETGTWLVRPHAAHRPVNPAVPDEFQRDYKEATAILDLSPRMSAVLSRRILGDLLARYAGHNNFGLAARIDAFCLEKTHPSRLTDNLHHFREIADFGAHTQKNTEAEIIDVGRDEAEWTLDLVDRLFDYFIVEPEKDRQMRERMDKKLADAGRKPIESPQEDES
jgi:hypothetical protein